MITQLYGLAFRVHSPSWFELAPASIKDENLMGDRVHVCYDGQRWLIAYEYNNGHIARRMFKSRDAAMCLIANRAC